MLPKGASTRPGPWQTEAFQREFMDALLDPAVQVVVCRKSTQLGLSEALNNILGYFIDADPKPILMVQPTDGAAKSYSKKRITPMIEHSPALKGKVRQATSRRAGNTTLLKEFDGGFLKLAGANSGAGLRSDPIAVLLLDEVDAYPPDVDGEGDPIEIAKRRTDTFDDAKIAICSTPGKPRGISRIEAEYERSSQGEFWVACPWCGQEQALVWRDEAGTHRLVWDKDEQGFPIAGTVRYLCAGCGQGIDEKFKGRMLAAGRWVHRHPERAAIRGYALNALYSPWKPIWEELAIEWAEAQENPERLKAFVNLRLGETWDEGGESFGAHVLARHRERYAAEVPDGAAVLVAATDVQHNRVEAQITAFGAGEESWLIAHEVFWGDPGAAVEVDVWAELDRWLLQERTHESGAKMLPAIALVDSGAHADSVYDFVLPRQHTRRRVMACKGVDYLSKPGLVAEGSTRRAKIRLWMVATYAAKDRVFARMKIPRPGPGYMHLPTETTDEYLEQLTGEKKIAVRDKRTRTKKYIYVKTHTRNEALDLTVYCHAGLFVLQNYLDPLAYRDLARLADRASQGLAADHPAARARRVRSPGI